MPRTARFRRQARAASPTADNRNPPARNRLPAPDPDGIRKLPKSPHNLAEPPLFDRAAANRAVNPNRRPYALRRTAATPRRPRNTPPARQPGLLSSHGVCDTVGRAHGDAVGSGIRSFATSIPTKVRPMTRLWLSARHEPLGIQWEPLLVALIGVEVPRRPTLGAGPNLNMLIRTQNFEVVRGRQS